MEHSTNVIAQNGNVMSVPGTLPVKKNVKIAVNTIGCDTITTVIKLPIIVLAAVDINQLPFIVNSMISQNLLYINSIV